MFSKRLVLLLIIKFFNRIFSTNERFNDINRRTLMRYNMCSHLFQLKAEHLKK